MYFPILHFTATSSSNGKFDTLCLRLSQCLANIKSWTYQFGHYPGRKNIASHDLLIHLILKIYIQFGKVND